MKNMGMVALLLSVGMIVGGCQSSRSGNVYTRDQARVSHDVMPGVVESVSEVQIEGTKTPIGTIAGGAMGGVLGSAVGGGSGKRIATVGGALAGAAVGAAAEEGITRKKALEIMVKLDSGTTMSIVQEADQTFAVGDRVRVLKGSDGTVRVRH